ncbi:MAG: tetratricopeptide repeat protein [Planctomycetota bacterium]|nr:tetratricopeptide repeat protein [Planctomycetota bacterium]
MSSETTLERALKDAHEGRLDAALVSVRLLVKRKPHDLDAVQIYGMLLMKAGEMAQAIYHLERAVTVAPNVTAYRNNYANALMNSGRSEEAVAQLRKAIEIDPNYSRGYLNMILACAAIGDSLGGIEAGRRGLALRPDWPELSGNLAGVLKDAGRVEEAIAEYQRAVATAPTNAGLRSGSLFSMNYPDFPVEFVAQAHRDYAKCVRTCSSPARTDPSPDRPLRLGILSGDMRTHSVAYFAEPFMRHRPQGCTLTIFATDVARVGDEMRDGIRSISDKWVEAFAMGDEALDHAIRKNQIDVLVELGGHTSGGQLTALDSSPAPVIVSAIGYPNTTGHPAVGWRIVDSFTDGPESDALCTERLLRIDPCFLCYSPPKNAPEPAMPAVDSPIIFGSFNLAAKITPRSVALWAGVLNSVPNSRLLLKCKAIADPGSREFFLERLAASGIPPERVDIVAYTSNLHDHWNLYSRVHVALDTTPYNGTTTTCEALWMGVPLVTIAGDRHSARVSTSILHAAGHKEWVANSPTEFASIAANLATDRAKLTELRDGLRGQVKASVLCDQVAYAERFHNALRKAWRSWCASVK